MDNLWGPVYVDRYMFKKFSRRILFHYSGGVNETVI